MNNLFLHGHGGMGLYILAAWERVNDQWVNYSSGENMMFHDCHTHTHTYIYIYVYKYIYVYIYIFMYIYIYV